MVVEDDDAYDDDASGVDYDDYGDVNVNDDDDDLVVFGGEDPFDGCDFVELWNFFFYIQERTYIYQNCGSLRQTLFNIRKRNK